METQELINTIRACTESLTDLRECSMDGQYRDVKLDTLSLLFFVRHNALKQLDQKLANGDK